MSSSRLPNRLAQANCADGRHSPGQVTGGTEYGGIFSGGRQVCTVCGAARSVSGGKMREPPYWLNVFGEWTTRG